MCPHCEALINTSERVCPYCNEQVAPRRVDRSPASGMFAGFIPHARFNTVVILLINLGLYFATSIYSMKSGRGNAMNIDVRTLFDFGAKFGPAIGAGQWWRLVTAGFLHGGMVHILMNSWVLFDLGAAVEEIYGASRMLVIYFVSTVAGFYLSALWNPQVPSVGASAALFGMVGAMLALGVRHRNPLGQAIRGVYMRYVIYMLLFSLLPGIDMAAHIGGLIGGFATAYLAGADRYSDAPVEKFWRIASWCCILITGASFLKMYLWLMGAPQ